MPWLFNYRALSRNEDIVKMLAALAYYGITTYRSKQTLGEEYSQIAQFSKDTKTMNEDELPAVPFKRRALFIFLATIFPVISARFLKKLYNRYKSDIEAKVKDRTLLKAILSSMPDYDALVNNFFRLNLMLFFIKGIYFQISRRFAGLKFIHTKEPQDHGITYKNVGIVLLIQIVGEAGKWVYKTCKTYKSMCRQL